MRRLFQAGTGSLYSLSPECFRLPFGGVTCSFPPLNGAPRPRPLLPCLLRWSTSNERKRDSVHTKTKKTWRISREWIWELNFSAWVGNTLLKGTLHIGNPEKHELLHRYSHIIPIELYTRLSLVYEDQWLANVTNSRISIQKLQRRYSLSLSKKWPGFSRYVIICYFSDSDWLKLYACSS